MKARVLLLIVLGMAGGLAVPGCATYRNAATGEKANYTCETLHAKLDLPIDTVYAAARKAAKELRLKVARAAEDGISGEIRATDAQHDTVDICLGALPEGRTRLEITVGVFGDKNKSIVVFNRIIENLGPVEQVAAARPS